MTILQEILCLDFLNTESVDIWLMEIYRLFSNSHGCSKLMILMEMQPCLI